ncbi:MAG: hypothetical protein HKN68_14720 [Saprospiraceae bacterium]|nr:hypothetical protein [Saprospiraceae bacterium]
MNWKQWVASKKKIYIGIVLFIVAYIITIPWRNYERLLKGSIDISEGVPIWIHLIIIVIGLIVFIILLKIIELIVKKKVLKNKL